MDIEPTEQEKQMLSILRELGGGDHYRIVIEFDEGAWQIEIAAPSDERQGTARGVGATFDEAWAGMAPDLRSKGVNDSA
jgi:hypothetical protein